MTALLNIALSAMALALIVGLSVWGILGSRMVAPRWRTVLQVRPSVHALISAERRFAAPFSPAPAGESTEIELA